MIRTTRLKKPQIPDIDALYTFDELGGRPKYGGVEMTSETNIPSFQEIMDETHSVVDAEAVARNHADDALEAKIQALAGQTSGALENEVTARVAADTALREFVNSEASTRSAADNALQNQIDAKADKVTTYTKTEVDTALGSKQDKLTAGTGINITNDVISVTTVGPRVVQTTGASTTDVMSQKAVTDALAEAGGALEVVDTIALDGVSKTYTMTADVSQDQVACVLINGLVNTNGFTISDTTPRTITLDAIEVPTGTLEIVKSKSGYIDDRMEAMTTEEIEEILDM